MKTTFPIYFSIVAEHMMIKDPLFNDKKIVINIVARS